MKKIILSIFITACFSSAFAQSVTDSVALGAPSSGSYIRAFMHDSVSLGAAYPNDVFYNMRTGIVATQPGGNWHIAFATRKMQSANDAVMATSIIANEGRGVKVFQSTYVLGGWHNFDTTGYATWPNPHNSDSTWNIGAFNQGSSGAFDFGWGAYDMTTHNVLGEKIYLIRIQTGTSYTFKKVCIQALNGDAQWVFTSSNLDNSDSASYTINKADFPNKLFAYRNLLTNTTLDREPIATAWDLLFTRYGANATQSGVTVFSTNTGALSNPAIRVSKVTGVPFILSTPGAFTDNITAIGSNWKINPGPGQPTYVMIDSLSYFVKAVDGMDDKLAFEGFGGSATGTIYFRKEFHKAISGISYPNDVFYNMDKGTVATVPGQNWHLGFSVRPAAPPYNVFRSTTILANEGRGVKVYESAQAIGDFPIFDTTGYSTWVTPHNSDSTWDIGALNANRNPTDGFDFGWGAYDQTTHNLTGSKIFLVRLTLGSGATAVTTFKKVMIEALNYDSQWVFTYANLDNSGLKHMVINKPKFAGKLFAYHNLLNDTTYDREPAAKWDLLFTRYGAFATQFGVTEFTTNTGALTYPTVLTSKVAGVPVDSAAPGAYTSFLTGIGTDWKINPGPGQPAYVIKDSLSYFTKGADTREDKLVFKAFRGASTGVIVFNKTNIKLGTGLNDIKEIGLIGLYPNPASSAITIEMKDAKNYAVTIYDVTGKTQISTSVNGTQNTVDISGLRAGIYFVSIENDGAKKVARLIIQ